jgi:hypothetical protein
MMRSLFSLIRIYQTKGIPVPLQKIIQPYLKLKDENMSASNIKIEVTENNKQIVYMILPITSLDNLQDLMPEKVTNKVLEDGLNINSIIQKVKDTDFLPQDLFCLQIVERKYHVWID